MGCCGTSGGGSSPATPLWVKRTLTFADFAAAALSNAITLYALPAGGVLHAVKIKHSAAFGGGAIATYTVSVGIAATPNKYATAFNVFQAPASNTFQVTGTVGGEDQASAVNLVAQAVSTGANLNAANAGSVEIWLLISTAV